MTDLSELVYGFKSSQLVMIFICRDIPKQKQRQQTSEHPFGTIKHYDGAGYFLCKGKEKVTAEYALICLGYDIRRAITICGGVKPLIPKVQRDTSAQIAPIGGNMRGETPFFMSKCASKDINNVKNVRKLYVFGQIVVRLSENARKALTESRCLV